MLWNKPVLLLLVVSTYICKDAEAEFKAWRRDVEESEFVFSCTAADCVVAWQRCSSYCLGHISSDSNVSKFKVRPCIVVSVIVLRQQGNQLIDCHVNVCFAFF